jgi:hemoglobin
VPETRPSVFEFAGGTPAFLALAAAHHERCLQDPVLNHPFSHPGHPQHVERLASYWAEVFGGPPVYSQSCGGQSAMLGIHAGQGAGGDLGDRFVGCFVQAADDAGLPDDADFRMALRSYMEWAVAEVVSYSPSGSEVPPELPVPRWSWDGLQDTDRGSVTGSGPVT